MKNLEYYLSLPYSIELTPDEEGFVATIPDLPGCMSSGLTPLEAIDGLNDAKELWIAGRLEKNQPIPEPTQIDDYSGKFVLRIPRSLHKSLDYEAKKQGISLNQYLVYLLSERNQAAKLVNSLKLVTQQLAEHSIAPQHYHPDWSWSEDAAFGEVHVCGSRATHDPLDMIGDVFSGPMSHKMFFGKQLTEKREKHRADA